MVSTRRSGSLSGNNNNSNNSNNNKRSSYSEDKPSSPKRQKRENGEASEKSTPEVATDNSKELYPPVPSDPAECGPLGDASITEGCGGDGGGGGETVSSGKEEAEQAVAVVTPIAEGSTPAVLEKPRSSFSSWSLYHKKDPNFKSSTPWCKLLTQSGQNPNVNICTMNFTIGSGRNCDYSLKDHTISAVLCRIKHTQHEGSIVAVLESTGSKGTVQVNGNVIKKNARCVISSGDEVVFGLLGNHAYIFQQLMTEVAVKGAEIHLERRSGDASAFAGASILASLYNVRQDFSTGCRKPAGLSTSKLQRKNMPVHSLGHSGIGVELDFLEGNSNHASDKATDVGASSKNLPCDGNLDSGVEADNANLSGVNEITRPYYRMLTQSPSFKQKLSKNVLKQVFGESNDEAVEQQPALTSSMSLRCQGFKEDILARILDGNGNDTQVSFDDFPYYLSESTKTVLIAASFIHLKHKKTC